MHNLTGNRVVLHVLKERQLGADPYDIEVNEDTVGCRVMQHIGECLCVDLDVSVFGAPAVDNGRNEAFATHLLKNAGPCAVAFFCL